MEKERLTVELPSPPLPVHIAIDRGGTFTDVYARCGERIFTEKLLSSDPARYHDATSEGVRRILSRITGRAIPAGSIPASEVGWIRMGTTVATNALLERKGAACALAITGGFGDLLRVGYQNRPELFALNIVRPELLYREVVEIDERVRPVVATDDGSYPVMTGTDGQRFCIIQSPDPQTVRDQLEAIYARGIRSLAVVLMHGYSFTDHERLVGEIAAKIGFEHISLSNEVMPRIRIVGRGDTTCVDAYLTPHINAYLSGFQQDFENRSNAAPLFFMQSDGGLTGAGSFRGCNAILSGPAGGVVGYAATTYEQMGCRPVIGFDMGGTSTDVSRFAGGFDLVHETETAGVRIQAPQLAIRTVAAGGGSRLFYRNQVFAVGPESAGAHPGPVCYRKDGHLAVTDANLLLGRLHPAFFPQIFGPREDMPLDADAVQLEFTTLTETVNADLKRIFRPAMSPEEVALGFLEVANEVMVRPIREISVMRGFNIKEHVLACFGGAGGQHAVAIARKLGIGTVFVHRQAGILSALGIAAADVVVDRQEPAGARPLASVLPDLLQRLAQMAEAVTTELNEKGYPANAITVTRYLNLRYEGTDTSFMIACPADNDFAKAFTAQHKREFGFVLAQRPLLADDIRIRAAANLASGLLEPDISGQPGEPSTMTRCYFAGGWLDTPVYALEGLGAGQDVDGPALIIQSASTILVEPGSTATITRTGNIVIQLHDLPPARITTEPDPIHLAVFNNRFMSIAEQMGRILQKTALSTNIKERLDFSCAVFDPEGGLVANAPHVPVHLGAMGEAVKHQLRIRQDRLRPGDVLLSNHPAAGGSHLPDMTVITPVWQGDAIRFFVASRGHHSDIGGTTPGSMPPFSAALDDEGVHVLSFRLVKHGVFREEKLRNLLAGHAYPARDPETVVADIKAQVAANQRGIDLLNGLMNEMGEDVVTAYMHHIQVNAESSVRAMLKLVANRIAGEQDTVSLAAEDYLDDGSPIRLRVEIDRLTGDAIFDFSGTGAELAGNLNAPPAVTRSAVLYALRCLIDQDIPLNQGCLNPVTIVLPEGSLLNPSPQAAVVGGNVLTSQRVVDVIFKAFAAVAASQGCMNNLTFGDNSFGYYETIGGGAGAGPGWHGCSGVHTHMTNTRITDPEVLEQRYPVMVRAFSLRSDSGGDGQWRGGDGLVRDLEFLSPMQVSILSERRTYQPYGLAGGEPGKPGENLLIRADSEVVKLPGRAEVQAGPGDRVRILTPGGGGWGKK